MASKKTGLQPNNFSGFGFKLSFQKKRNTGIDHVHLEHTEDGHSKFYIMQLLTVGNSSLTNFTVAIKFGKIGAAGSIKKHGFQTLSDAYKFINKKLGQELRKGYKRIN